MVLKPSGNTKTFLILSFYFCAFVVPGVHFIEVLNVYSEFSICCSNIFQCASNSHRFTVD